jgi:hypothetical protein
MLNFGAFVSMFVGFVVLAVAAGFLLSYPLMLLWNGCLVPAVPVLNEVEWIQMWGILVLFGFLFKSISSK